MDSSQKTIIISMLTNLLLSLLKISVGIIFSFTSLIADGMHSLSDLITDVIAMVGYKLSIKKPTKKYPYGYGKLEYLTSIIIGIIILFLGFTIIYKSFNMKTVFPNIIIILVIIISILTKYLLSKYVIKMGLKYQNSILIASGYESSVDVISSMIVLLCSVLTLLSSYINIFRYCNILASIIVGILIVKIGFDILKENMNGLLDIQDINNECIEKIRKLLLNHKWIKTISNIVLLKYGSYYRLVLEISVDKNNKIKDINQNIELIKRKIMDIDSKIKYIEIDCSK